MSSPVDYFFSRPASSSHSLALRIAFLDERAN